MHKKKSPKTVEKQRAIFFCYFDSLVRNSRESTKIIVPVMNRRTEKIRKTKPTTTAKPSRTEAVDVVVGEVDPVVLEDGPGTAPTTTLGTG